MELALVYFVISAVIAALGVLEDLNFQCFNVDNVLTPARRHNSPPQYVHPAQRADIAWTVS